jgi:hypothetical protein
VILGKVSYSAYLVHWPVLVVMRYLGLVVNGWHMLTSVSYMCVCTMLLYVYVEWPCRNVQNWKLHQVFLRFLVIPVIVIVCVSGAGLLLLPTAEPMLNVSPLVEKLSAQPKSSQSLFLTDKSCRLPYHNATPPLPWKQLGETELSMWTKCSPQNPHVCFVDDQSPDANRCVKKDYSNCYYGDRNACGDDAIALFGE